MHQEKKENFVLAIISLWQKQKRQTVWVCKTILDSQTAWLFVMSEVVDMINN